MREDPISRELRDYGRLSLFGCVGAFVLLLFGTQNIGLAMAGAIALFVIAGGF